MIVHFSKNPFKQVFAILYFNLGSVIFFGACATLAYILCIHYNYESLILPAIPVSILGGALAIFLGFKNSSAYDRWWEARKIWGAVVNDSRSIAMELSTYGIPKDESDRDDVEAWKRRTVMRHIGWVHALRHHLRKEPFNEDLCQWIEEKDAEKLRTVSNVPAQLIAIQAKDVKLALRRGWIDEFRFNAIMVTMKKLYDDQGKCERIKNTVFPFYYNYFTNFFLYLFTFSLPFALAGEESINSWILIPVSVAISFAFSILNKTGLITENPFEGRAADTPMSTISTGIQIDLMEMIDEIDVPDPVPDSVTKFGVVYKS
jgi:ion channel-forming bestrophin family protein